MANLPWQSFSTMVANTVAGIQSRASSLIDFSTGSTLRAIVEGFGGLYLWFQALALQLLQASRLSTAIGLDVDTFTADYMPIIPGSETPALPGGSPRLGAQAATGLVTFSRFTPSPAVIFVPVGTTVQSGDGTQTFSVIAETTFPNYLALPLPGGYTMAAQVTSLIVPVQAVVPGTSGNVQAGAISLITSTITPVSPDTVTNVSPFTNGVDQESDSALKARFAAYILGLSRGDIFGLTASIEGAETNVQFALTEDYNLVDGSFRPGFFFVVADDGSGSPSPLFLQAITNAANAVRPLGIQCAVFPPTIIFATVSMQITTAANYNHQTLVAQVSALVAENINNLGLGNPLPYSILASWAYSIPGVTSVQDVLLNSLSGDTASLSATKLSQDGFENIVYATIKCSTAIVS